MIAALLASGNPLNHVVQHAIVQVGKGGFPDGLWGFTFLSNHIIMQLVAAALLIYFLPRFVRRRAGQDEIGRLVPRGWGNAIEGLCEALRTHVARPALGEHTDRFVPYIWSAFFFVLTCNVLGMIPLANWTPFIGGGHVLGGTSTGNLWITAALAISTLFMIVYNGLRTNGMAYVKHFFMGPPGLNVFIALLEMMGLGFKTFALAMRLFANMIAGHILLAILLSFVGDAAKALGAGGAVAISIPVILGSVAINFLELFVAFLQAFIFTFLSAMFIGQAVNIHHEHHEQAPAGAEK
jgi:F-type H+-transporting ATPase subunit a